MRQLRLKDLTIGQYFTMCRGCTRFTKIYKVVAKNDNATLVFVGGKYRTFKNDIVVYLQHIFAVSVSQKITDEFVDYLNKNNHIVFYISYGNTELTDEVIYL